MWVYNKIQANALAEIAKITDTVLGMFYVCIFITISHWYPRDYKFLNIT